MTEARYFFTYLPLIKAKTEAKKAEVKANIIPKIYFVSTLKIIYNPQITNKPKKISYHITFLLYHMGSKTEVNNAAVEIVANVTETLETLTAIKKVIQCNAIRIPVIKSPKSACF